MQTRSRQEAYHTFIEFIARDIQYQRNQISRRVLSVFIWCLGFPMGVSLILLILIKARVLGWSARTHLDWIVLIFPVSFSLYVLGAEVLAQVPKTVRKGSGISLLSQPIQESEWREKVLEGLEKAVHGNSDEWSWIVSSFKMDLITIQDRTRYLTALSGAVFFLLMQGMDLFVDPAEQISWGGPGLLTRLQSFSGGVSQLLGLGFFLMLLYLSGSQSFLALRRYLNCAELIQQRLAYKESHKK